MVCVRSPVIFSLRDLPIYPDKPENRQTLCKEKLAYNSESFSTLNCSLDGSDNDAPQPLIDANTTTVA